MLYFLINQYREALERERVVRGRDRDREREEKEMPESAIGM